MENIHQNIKTLVENAQTLNELIKIDQSKQITIKTIDESLKCHPLYHKLENYKFTQHVFQNIRCKNVTETHEISQLLSTLVQNPTKFKIVRQEMGGIDERVKTIIFNSFSIIYHCDDCYTNYDEWILIKSPQMDDVKFLVHREGMMITFKPDKAQLELVKQRLQLTNCSDDNVLLLLKLLGKFGKSDKFGY